MQRALRQYRCHWIDVVSRASLVMNDGVVLAAVRQGHVYWTVGLLLASVRALRWMSVTGKNHNRFRAVAARLLGSRS